MVIDNSIKILQDSRLEILKRYKEGRIHKNEYNSIIEYLNYPYELNTPHDINDYNLDLSELNNPELVNLCILELYSLYKKNKKYYKDICQNGQYIVWNYVFRCAENLIEIKNTINNLDYTIRENNYFESCAIVREYLNHLASGYKEMVILEKRMGVDRYLATSGLKDDISILHEILREIRGICNFKLKEAIDIFQKQWNLTSISKSIEKSLNYDVDDDQISSSMTKNHERVIFLLLDGLGFTQYLWFLNGIKGRKSLTFSTNLFEWLQNYDEYKDKFVLGSTLVTDTASAMATIFSGEMPADTGIISSKVYYDGKIKDIKKVKGRDISNIVEKYPNTFLNKLDKLDISVLDGSGSYLREYEESFSKMIYGNANIIPVNPPDRIFKRVIEEIKPSKQLLVAYFPLIDRTGHSIGSFTSFESYEYEKLNILMVEFLLDLAYNKKEIFDGKTKIIISADHGMFETSSKYITLEEIKIGFKSRHLYPPMIAINNRSIILYNIYKYSLEDYKKSIIEILNEKDISHSIYSINDKESEFFIPIYMNGKKTVLIVLFDSDGIAIPNKDINEVLLHYGGHGGHSCEEVFVPFITIELSPNLHSELIKHFSKLK